MRVFYIYLDKKGKGRISSAVTDIVFPSMRLCITTLYSFLYSVCCGVQFDAKKEG